MKFVKMGIKKRRALCCGSILEVQYFFFLRRGDSKMQLGVHPVVSFVATSTKWAGNSGLGKPAL